MKLLRIHLPRLLMFYVLQFVLFELMDILWTVQRPMVDVLVQALFIGTCTYAAVAVAEARSAKAKLRSAK